jgi:hypothetical protein
MMAEERLNRSGRKCKWHSGQTQLIRIPKKLLPQVLEFAQQLDEGDRPPPPKVRELHQEQLEEIDRYEILIYLKENFHEFVPKRDVHQQLMNCQAKLREQKQLTANIAEVESLQVEVRTKNDRISSLQRQCEELTAQVASLCQQKANLMTYSSAANDSERRITEILKLLQQESTGTSKVYVDAIFNLVAGVQTDWIDLCLAIMQRLTEKDKRYNNCCRDAAKAAMEGKFTSIESAMDWVEREYQVRKEQHSSKD